jgi:hypothetical protein
VGRRAVGLAVLGSAAAALLWTTPWSRTTESPELGACRALLERQLPGTGLRAPAQTGGGHPRIEGSTSSALLLLSPGGSMSCWFRKGSGGALVMVGHYRD